MATYVIGDVQGCYEPLMRLVERIRYDPARDTLWFVGDLVNRGPQSCAVLRFVRSLGRGAVTVLGNHDLALLVVSQGIRRPHAGDTFGDVLTAPDRDELLYWLRHQKMIHAESGYLMVHAGLLPQWSAAQALELGQEVERALRGEDWRAFCQHMYGNEPARWSDALTGFDRLRVITNAFTRLRLCATDGTMEFSHKIGVENLPAGFMPWFDVPGRLNRGACILFGHWAALGLVVRDDVIGLDSGCVWGRALTALRLEDRRIFQCDCAEMAAPSDWQ
jgi:bis(5'-nucleosyl)-tetraphosphatase (symmetrical)